MIVKFEILGEPQGKGRPRFSTRGGFVKTYTPEKTASYENYVKLSYIRTNQGLRLTEAISISIEASFSIPKSFSKKKREEALQGVLKPLKKPDCDNIAKTILDALNGIAYDDDKQVYSLNVVKKYSDTPKVVVTLETKERGVTIDNWKGKPWYNHTLWE